MIPSFEEKTIKNNQIEIITIQETIDNLQKENIILQSDTSFYSDTAISEVMQEMDKINSMKQNLIVFGLPEPQYDNCEDRKAADRDQTLILLEKLFFHSLQDEGYSLGKMGIGKNRPIKRIMESCDQVYAVDIQLKC
ncbi:hypothetical protein JTB14_034842 [Gonioctena quinquepunctata]|nr:hypothetical protein JTB14_034842 [Gonioctena quinquepunctata]